MAVGLGWAGGSVGSGTCVRVGSFVGGRFVLVAVAVGVMVAVAEDAGRTVAAAGWTVALGCAKGAAVAVE